MKRRTIGFIEPIAGVKRQQLEFRALGQIRWFVDDQPPGTNACLDAHTNEGITDRAAQQALAADAARCDREAARLKRGRWADSNQLRIFQYPGRRFRWATATITISSGRRR